MLEEIKECRLKSNLATSEARDLLTHMLPLFKVMGIASKKALEAGQNYINHNPFLAKEMDKLGEWEEVKKLLGVNDDE